MCCLMIGPAIAAPIHRTAGSSSMRSISTSIKFPNSRPRRFPRPTKRRQGSGKREVEFVEFVQWTADQQLRSCKALADRLGMKVGLYLDVAVGVQCDGFDAWNEQAAISRHLTVGAPPDPLNTLGQNWGLAGFNAAGLEMRSFEPFRQMLQASMRHAGDRK